jgi:hypothetical protein
LIRGWGKGKASRDCRIRGVIGLSTGTNVLVDTGVLDREETELINGFLVRQTAHGVCLLQVLGTFFRHEHY